MSDSAISAFKTRLMQMTGLDEAQARSFVEEVYASGATEASTKCASELDECLHERAHLMRALAEARAHT
ncbi:hypothetical protein [Yinghuangia seranimata]|uniref:hypothetical protein n=1 Tax=Yinghuangia seranimata TaxID=408067 RepID=UPI00248C27D4|nr:hypothetical protein [Yinghuangia seranimata]MDI2127051.1 hypothetical protein [Yinghuangia seranimata]